MVSEDPYSCIFYAVILLTFLKNVSFFKAANDCCVKQHRPRLIEHDHSILYDYFGQSFVGINCVDVFMDNLGLAFASQWFHEALVHWLCDGCHIR